MFTDLKNSKYIIPYYFCFEAHQSNILYPHIYRFHISNSVRNWVEKWRFPALRLGDFSKRHVLRIYIHVCKFVGYVRICTKLYEKLCVACYIFWLLCSACDLAANTFLSSYDSTLDFALICLVIMNYGHSVSYWR